MPKRSRTKKLVNIEKSESKSDKLTDRLRHEGDNCAKASTKSESEELSELHKLYNEQIKTMEEWDNFMESAGLTSLKNFEFLPRYKPEISIDMLVYDYGKDPADRWKIGMRYPLRGEIVTPHVLESTE
jgi:hypothetical protein